MTTKLKQNCKQLIAVFAFLMIVVTSIPAYAKEKSEIDSSSRFLTVSGKEMHIVLYGDMTQSGTEVSFTDKNKTTLVMMPALAIESPHLYYKPLAQALDSNFNIVIVEPLGNGLSDMASTTRTVDNINKELKQALDLLEIQDCVLMVHSISGVYGLNFVNDYPEKVKGFIAIDNTIYDEELQGSMALEQEYMLNMTNTFSELRNSFPTVEDFQLAITNDPVRYGAQLPQITGYTYPVSDMPEYIQAFSKSCNDNIKDEITQLDEAMLTIKDKKFPDSLPVLMMIASANVDRMPAWETGHRNQLNLESANHEFHILEGDHYIWYTNLTGVVDQIKEWQTRFQF